MRVILEVEGHPTPQGSKRAWVQNGQARMMEQTGDRLRTWRQDVKAAAIAVRPPHVISDPVEVQHVFRFPRPKSHYGTGRNAGILKRTAPRYPSNRATGDIEKLVRSTHDALTSASVWVDDSLVVALSVRKLYATNPRDVGDLIVIRTLTDSAPTLDPETRVGADTTARHPTRLGEDAARVPGHPTNTYSEVP